MDPAGTVTSLGGMVAGVGQHSPVSFLASSATRQKMRKSALRTESGMDIAEFCFATGPTNRRLENRQRRQLDHIMNSNLFPSEQQLCTAKIFIIDDEMAVIRMLEWALQKAQFPNFRSLTDPTRAQKEFEQFQPDLVLLDWHMPKLDGFAVLAQLRKSAPASEFLPVLVITGENTAEMRSRALAAGANDFLGKPIDYTEVILRIRNLLQTRFLHRRAGEVQAQLEALSEAKETNPRAKSGRKK